MNTPSQELPPVESVAAELGIAVASDFLRKHVLGEHISHQGNDFKQYSLLIEQPEDESVTRYEYFQVMSLSREIRNEDE